MRARHRQPLLGCYTTSNCRSGAIRLRSAASLVTTTCSALRAQTTTWASTTSAVAVRANSRPTAVASGPLSATRSVPACRMSRDNRAWRAGLRMACASAVAGIVIRIPRSAARATNASTRRSFRSNAIRPPASKVTPLMQPSLSLGAPSAPAERETRQPMRVRFWLRRHQFAAVRPPASLSILPHRAEQHPQRAARKQKRSPPALPLPEREFPQPDRRQG